MSAPGPSTAGWENGGRCFACGQRLRKPPAFADTRDDQVVWIGPECLRHVQAAGAAGYQPPKGGPRLWRFEATAGTA